MTDDSAYTLIVLLRNYAVEHGPDCDPGLTVVELADDLATSLQGTLKEGAARVALSAVKRHL